MRRVLARHLQRLVSVHAGEALPVVGEDDRRLPVAAESVDRTALQHADLELVAADAGLSAASRGDTVAVDRSSDRRPARRSSLASPGIRAYIITMPEMNQAMNSTQPAMPEPAVGVDEHLAPVEEPHRAQPRHERTSARAHLTRTVNMTRRGSPG